MGFDVKRFKSASLLKEIPRLFCLFCKNVLKQPSSLATCGHIFCRQCARDLAQKEGECPEDGLPFSVDDVTEGPNKLQQILFDLEIGCDFASLGCKQFMELKHLTSHCTECPFNPNALLECPEKCGASFRPKDKASHSCASYLLSVIKDNEALVKVVVGKRSREGIEVIKRIISAEKRVNEKLKALIDSLALNGSDPQPRATPRVESMPRLVSQLNVNNGLDGQPARVAPDMGSSEAGTSSTRMTVIFEKIKVEKKDDEDQMNRNEVIIITDEDDDEEENYNERRRGLKADQEEGEGTPSEAFNHSDQGDDMPADEPAFRSLSTAANTQNRVTSKQILSRNATITSKGCIISTTQVYASSSASSTPKSSVKSIPFTESQRRSKIKSSHNSPKTSDTSLPVYSTRSARKAIKDEEDAENGEDAYQGASVREDDLFTDHQLNLTCDLCSHTFITNSHLMAHQPCYFTSRGIPETTKGNFNCDVCGKTFPGLSLLKNHLVYHLDKNRYECNVCGKGFCISGHIRVHVRTHTAELNNSRLSGVTFTQNKPSTPPPKLPIESFLAISLQEGEQEEEENQVMDHDQDEEEGDEENMYEDEEFNQDSFGDGSQRQEENFTVNELDLTCELCQNKFTRKSYLLAHLPCYFTSRGMKGKTNEPLDCQFCEKSFTNVTQMRQHLIYHVDEKRYSCNFCGKQFYIRGHVVCHIQTHTGERPFKCNFCEKTFTQRGHLNAHVRGSHRERKQPPRIRPRPAEPLPVTPRVEVLKIKKERIDDGWRTIDTNYSMSPNGADVYDERFEHLAIQQGHVKVETNLADEDGWVVRSLESKGRKVQYLMKRMAFPCNLCGITFNRKSLQMVHQPCYSARTGVKGRDDEALPHQCEFCSHRCNEMHNLRKHLEIHVDLNIYKCIDCGKQFCREQGIRVHQRLHSGDQPYACKYCQKRFSQWTSLNDHKRLHTGEKPFRCLWPGCMRRFSKLGARADHMKRSHKKIKDNVCPFFGCNKYFVTKSEVTKHVKRHHLTKRSPFPF